MCEVQLFSLISLLGSMSVKKVWIISRKSELWVFFSCFYVFFLILQLLETTESYFTIKCLAAIFPANHIALSLFLSGTSTAPTGYSLHWLPEKQLKFSDHKYSCVDTHATWAPVESWEWTQTTWIFTYICINTHLNYPNSLPCSSHFLAVAHSLVATLGPLTQ